MNPPYSCPGVWIAKLQAEFDSGRVEEAIALVPVATDTKWFHPLIASNLICFWRGRIKFLDVNYQPKMAARQSHCLIYWGKNQSRFREIFSPFGSFNSSESVTSKASPISPVTKANAQPETYIIDQYESLGIIKDNFDFGFVVDWLGFGKVPVPPSGQNLSYIWERDDELIGKLAIAPQALIEKFLEETQLISTINAPSVTHSYAELPPSPSVESFISTQSDIKLLSTQEVIEALSISEDELDEFWNNEPALFKGFKIQWLGATIQKWRVEPNTFLKDKLPQSESIPEKFLEDKKQSPSIESLSLSSIESNVAPENFLEESTADTKQLPSQKRRQRKGCLYKYLENKKLKNGNIASYPRVTGETRDPDLLISR